MILSGSICLATPNASFSHLGTDPVNLHCACQGLRVLAVTRIATQLCSILQHSARGNPIGSWRELPGQPEGLQAANCCTEGRSRTERTSSMISYAGACF